MDKGTRLDLIELTRGYLGVFLMAILMSTGVVTGLYAGESQTITLPEDYAYYSIVGNSTPVDLELSQVGLDITITVDKYMKDDSFSLVFFNKEKEVITNTVYTGGGGGSSRTKYIYNNITKPVPIYTDVEVIKEVPVEKLVEVPGESLPADVAWWVWVIVVIASFLMAWVIMSFRKTNKVISPEYVHRREESEYG